MKRRLQPVFEKVLASVADQGVASSTNFLMNVLLARWLLGAEYGAFSVTWSFCAIFSAFHNALIMEPMTIIGPAEYSKRLGSYLKQVDKLHWLLAAALSAAAVVTAVFYRQATVQRTMFALAFGLPGYLLLLTRRREQHVLHQPIRALRLSLIYAVLVGGVLWVLFAAGRLSAISGMLTIAVAWIAALFAPKMKSDRDEAEALRGLANQHWRYGKWLFASSVLAVGIPDVQTILLSLLVDLKSAGALRMLMNFVLPLSQLMAALNIYALPRFAKRMKESGVGAGLRHIVLFPAAMVLVGLVYSAALIIGGPLLERALYNGRMSDYLTYLPLLLCGTMLAVVAGGFSTLLRAAQNSQHQFLSGVTGTVVGVSSAFTLLKAYGVRGALWSMILANGAAAAVVVGAYGLALRRNRGSWAPLHYLRESK